MSTHELLHDPVDVRVEFSGHRVRPTCVRWGTRDYPMERVNLVHSTKEGEARIFYFSVSDNTTFMKLRFDTQTLEWRLVELYTE
jgi:hypothetical protein